MIWDVGDGVRFRPRLSTSVMLWNQGGMLRTDLSSNGTCLDFIRSNPRLADSELSRNDEDAAGLGAFDSAVGGGDQKVEGSVAVYVSQSG